MGPDPRELVEGPCPINDGSFKRPLEIMVGADSQAEYQTNWWSYASNIGESGFSVKRFSKSFSVQVINRSRSRARLMFDGELIDLPYGK